MCRDEQKYYGLTWKGAQQSLVLSRTLLITHGAGVNNELKDIGSRNPIGPFRIMKLNLY